MRVSELKGPTLDFWVAKAEELDDSWFKNEVFGCLVKGKLYAPSTKWAIGGPLIDKYRNSPAYDERTEDWFVIYEVNSKKKEFREIHGETSLIAFCRYIVASKFGETVDDSQTD